ncbi:MAG: response regulator [Pseudomonadota bacterium]
MNSQSDLRSVFDRVVLETLGPLMLATSIAFAVYSVLGFFEDYSEGVRWRIVTGDAVCALLCLALYLQLRRGSVPPQRSSIVGVLVGQLAITNALLDYSLVGDHFFLVYVPIIMVGYGAFLLSRRWFAASMLCSIILALIIAGPTLSGATLFRYAHAGIGAALLGAVLLVVRRWSVQTANAALRAARSENTQRRQLEARLAQSQRLESVGRLVSGIAHDFNNLLMPIIGYADLALSRLRKNDPLVTDLAEIRKAGENAASLTAKLLAFSRQQVLQTEILDINDVINATRRLIERTMPENVTLRFDLTEEESHVRVDPIQIQQVLLNLTINARDAMPDGGRLTISTKIIGANLQAPAPMVELRVSDTGMGIDPAVREQIFEPFFTTKAKEHGTGLGLATAHGIVSQSGGSISADSTPGSGAHFRVLLPRVAPHTHEAAPPSTDVDSALGGETVLLVEDERPVRAVVVAALRSNGYQVLEADDPKQALSIAANNPFDILVTDVVMPGMNGVELAERLRAAHTSVPVVFMSGYAPPEALQDAGGVDNAQFVRKPFRAGELVAAVQAAVATSRNAGEAAELRLV